MNTSSSNDVNDESEPLIEIIAFDECDECNGDEHYEIGYFGDTHTIANEHPYIKKLLDNSKLHVLHEYKVYSTYTKYGVGGLIRLFIKDNFYMEY